MGASPVSSKAGVGHGFALTPVLSLKGEGELQDPGLGPQDDCKVDREANPVSPEPVEGRVLRIR